MIIEYVSVMSIILSNSIATELSCVVMPCLSLIYTSGLLKLYYCVLYYCVQKRASQHYDTKHASCSTRILAFSAHRYAHSKLKNTRQCASINN